MRGIGMKCHICNTDSSTMGCNHYLPQYSLADLYRDIWDGKAREFTYNRHRFEVVRRGMGVVITNPETAHTASTTSMMSNMSMTDLHGMAACLLEYKRSLIFGRDGNIIN